MLLRNYKKEAVLAPALKMLEAFFDLFVPLVTADIIDRGIASGDQGYIISHVMILILLGLLGLAASITAQYFAARAAVGGCTELRHELFAHIQSFGFGELDRVGTSTLITRMTSDINQVQNGMNLFLRLFLRSPFIVFGSMIMAFTISVRAALIFVAVIPVLAVVVFGIMKVTRPLYRGVQSSLDGVTKRTREGLNGVRVVRAFGREASETAHFRAENENLFSAQMHVGRISALMNPLTYVIVNIALIAILRSGSIQINAGALAQGQVIALVNYLNQILVELVKLANLIVTLTKSAACAGRISDLLEISPSQKDGFRELTRENLQSLTFRDVSISYSDSGDAALEHISFSASPGQTIGVIGGTGSGKTTLVNLIPRFYDHTSGEILWGNTPVQELTLSSLRGAIGVVPQHATLFQGTIRSNLLWGNPEASEQDLWSALETAQAAEIVRGKPGGLDEPVQQNGRNFSGGQKQRLTIARALVRRPAVLILDDSASALDFATDAALRRALRSMDNPPLTFIVSQRTASVRFCDRILVLEDGLCAGQGTHEELLASCPVYREIHEASAGKEESVHG